VGSGYNSTGTEVAGERRLIDSECARLFTSCRPLSCCRY